MKDKRILTQRAIRVNGHTLFPETKKPVYFRGHTEPGKHNWVLVSDTPKGAMYRVIGESLTPPALHPELSLLISHDKK
jgi:hypothetical protein